MGFPILVRCHLYIDSAPSFSVWLLMSIYICYICVNIISVLITGVSTRVSADTLVKMAEDFFIALVNYRQINRHGAFIGDPYFLRLLSLVWGTLRGSFKSLQAVIQPWFQLEKLRGDEGDAHFSFPGVEGDCFPCRGWRHGGRGWRMLNWSDGDWHITLSFLLFMALLSPVQYTRF